jgi:hypothetical protein
MRRGRCLLAILSFLSCAVLYPFYNANDVPELIKRANIHHGHGEHEEALKLFHQIDKIYTEQRMRVIEDYIRMIWNMGASYDHLGDYKNAIKYLSKAQTHYDLKEEQKSEKYASLMLATASIHRKYGNDDLALKFFKRGRIYYELIGLHTEIDYGHLLRKIANLYHDRGKQQEAIEMYLLAKKIYETRHHQQMDYYVGTLWELGIAYEKTRQEEKALELYFHGAEILRLTKATGSDIFSELMSAIAGIYENQGNSAKASQYHKMAITPMMTLRKAIDHLARGAQGQAAALLHSDKIDDDSAVKKTVEYARFVRDLGSSYKKSDPELAMDYLKKAANHFKHRRLLKTEEYALLLCELAETSNNLGDAKKQRNYYRDACRTFTKLASKHPMVEQSCNGSKKHP